MRISVRTLFYVSALILPACGGSDDPFGDSDTDGETDSGTSDGTTSDSAGSTSGGSATSGGTSSGSSDGTTDATTSDSGGSSGGGTTDATTGGSTGGAGCAPIPTRYIALGDSVVNGVGVNGKEGDGNAFKMAANYVRDNYAPGLAYENYGVNGAVTTDVPDNQIGNVPVGMSGHVVINIHIGGNDLANYIYTSDQEAIDGYDTDIVEMKEDWATIWAWANDTNNFPDGATLIINTQYNPWDDCDSPHLGVSISDTKTGLLHMYNDEVRAETNMHPNGIIADQHPKFLGHGHNYDNPECQHYMQGADYWMIGGFDFIHAGSGGHAAMAEVYNDVADQLYGACP